MDDFERLVIEGSIRSRVGQVERIDHCTRTQRTPMNVIIGVAEPSLVCPVELFWIDEGIAGHFCISGAESSAIVFHTRELLLLAHLRSLFENYWGPGIREMISKRLALKLLAEFLLQRGFIDQALQTFAKSTFDTGIVVTEPTIDDLEHMPFSEQYLVTWFFGLGHELGHMIAPAKRAALRSVPGISSNRIARVVDNYIIDRFPKLEEADAVRAIIRRNDLLRVSKCYASASILENELIADLFSLLTVCEASAEFFPEQKGMCGHRLLLETLIASTTLMMVDQCRILASWFTDNSNEFDEQNLTLSNIALGARINLIIGTLLDPTSRGQFQALHYFDELDEGRLRSELQTLNQWSSELGKGIEFSRNFVSSSEMRDTSLFYDLLDRLSKDTVLVYETRPFVKLGHYLGVQSPEFKMLSKAVS